MTTDSMTELKNKVIQIIEAVTATDQSELGADDEIIQLDSMKTIVLITQLEEEFGILVEDNDMLFENFSSINKICAIVQRYSSKE
ncbi:acyl carrier protein [Paenibacillus xylaniclasticus]|uniref:acyl carrier protein n=1 Tax=Paenibacillus xylaniclasticus TaxID=588083 RepID=UPI000FDC36DF|nr:MULTISPECIES: acyl carrier protein [Paenibacillus]GFN32225.1 hypothetical protein PCURB6_24850 [Paenibacillus curdlanolyticus]